MPVTSQTGHNTSMPLKVAASIAVTALVSVGLVAGVSDEAYAAACGDGTAPSTGDGSAGDPWQIASKDNLLWVSWATSVDNTNTAPDPTRAVALAANYLQTANEIDLSDCEWTPIGASGNEFEGEYDGNDKTITGLNINQPGTDLQGMFAATSGATIKDLNLLDVDIKGKSDVGGLIGLAGTATSVSNVDVSGVVSSPNSGDRDSDAGGLVGDNSGSVTNSSAAVAVSTVTTDTELVNHAGGFVGNNRVAGEITGSSATGDVAARGEVGGFVGNNQGTIQTSHATGSVSGTWTEVGGFAGINGDDDTDGVGVIENSYATGDVTNSGEVPDGSFLATGEVGGFVGDNQGAIRQSHATGAVTGDEEVGGFVGENEATISESYATGRVIAEDDQAGGFVGYNDGGQISDSYATGDASSNTDNEVGGFVGDNDGTITGSSASGNATTFDEFAGGFAGSNDTDGTIQESSATGTATTTEGDNAGGFVGQNKGTIEDSSATGNVYSGDDRAGGFVGDNAAGTISRSYATGDAETGVAATETGHTGGGFVGRNEATIEDSHATGDVVVEDYAGGGFVGDNWADGAISDSYATGAVNVGGNSGGGFAGGNSNGEITSSYATGNVVVAGVRAGGFSGNNYVSGVIQDSYATGTADASDIAGGFIGRSAGTISRSYSTGTATVDTGNSEVGGFLGRDNGTTDDSFWNITTSGLTNSDGGDGSKTNQASGKTTAEMTAIVTFNATDTSGLDTAWGIIAASSFGAPDGTSTEIWGIGSDVNCGYPFLHWQDQSGHVCVVPDSGSGNTGRDDDDSVAPVETATPSVATTRSRATEMAPPRPVDGPVLRGGVVAAPPRGATVSVGGVPTVVQESSPDPTTLSVLAGSLSVDVSVDEAAGEVSRFDDGVIRLSVKAGSAAVMRGTGLQSGANVQVFIPLSPDDSREVANLTVAADGTFSGELPVSTDPLAEPLPIGERLLQLVSVDADGNQVVLEMAVNVAQGDPAPALDRDAGDIPVVEPGATAVTSAGVVTEATTTALPDQNIAVVEGDTWNMAVAIDSEQGGVEPSESGALVTLVRDEVALVSGVGFMAGTRADVWLFSEPALLGTVTIDENGEFSGEVGIDPDLIPTGEHTLQLQGVGTDGYVKAANMGVFVDDAQPELAAAEQAGLNLSFIWWILAVIVLVAIVVAAWLRRSRRA